MDIQNNRKDKAQEQVLYRDQLLTATHLEEFRKNLLLDLVKVMKELAGQPGKKWLKSYEVKKLLGVSPGTLQNLRINGTLPFVKIGGVILYDYEDVQKMIQENKIDRRYRTI